MPKDITNVIAVAIKDADSSWFNENYTKQAQAVIHALDKQGFEICPKKAPDALVDYAVENLPFGRMKPEDFVKELYELLVANARKV